MREPTDTPIPEIYMQVKDPKQLEKLMLIQGVTRRDLAAAAGWKSHSYVNEILAGRIKTVTPLRAARIARFFEVGVDDLFVARLSSDAVRTVTRRGVA